MLASADHSVRHSTKPAGIFDYFQREHTVNTERLHARPRLFARVRMMLMKR
jgi:hypothetical protein